MDSATPTGNPAPGGATAGGAGPDGSGAATFPGGSGSAGDAADPSAERDAGDASGEVGDGVADAGTDAASGTDTGAARSACEALVGDPNVNWRDTSLQTDQEIVACLADSLGRPVGFGERALGGFDPDGGSRLIVITRGDDVSVEEQLESAVADDGHAWIVFDKRDFAEPTDVALYRLRCGDAGVQAALGVDDPALCLDHEAWCAARGVAAVDCLETFFNDRLDDGDLPIRNVRIGSNTTLDGRQSQARILFSGFAIGADSGGEPTTTADSVIVTNLLFRGAGHTEDHGLDPDMLRVTGASHDVWIHQNTFDLTGDSAFDVKVGAHDITISFNRVQNVKRASLHGSSDSREINAQITTTIHHNAFITTDDYYDTFGNTGRRVPLIRRGRSHMFNNVFYGYRKDVLSVRVGARVAFEDSLFLANPDIIGDDDLEYFTEELLADFREGGLEVSGSHVALSDGAYRIVSEPADLSASFGSTPDMLADYDQASRDTIAAHRMAAGQDLVDYVMATTGKGGTETFNAGP
jgi:pectate lyase